jgi:hypothetical protein
LEKAEGQRLKAERPVKETAVERAVEMVLGSEMAVDVGLALVLEV